MPVVSYFFKPSALWDSINKETDLLHAEGPILEGNRNKSARYENHTIEYEQLEDLNSF